MPGDPEFIGLGFDGGRLGFALVCDPAGGGCSHGSAYRYFAGKLEPASVPASLEDFALTGGRALWVDMPDDEDFHWNVEDAGSLPFGAS